MTQHTQMKNKLKLGSVMQCNDTTHAQMKNKLKLGSVMQCNDTTRTDEEQA